MSDKCVWKENETYFDEGDYTTGCGQPHFFSEGEIKENGYKYCPYCGKQIEEA